MTPNPIPQQTATVRPPLPRRPGWDGVERRSGIDRRSGKDRRRTLGGTLQGLFNWILARPNMRHGQERRQASKDRRARVRPY